MTKGQEGIATQTPAQGQHMAEVAMMTAMAVATMATMVAVAVAKTMAATVIAGGIYKN